MAQLLVPQPVTEMIDDLEVLTVPFPAFYALGLLPRLSKLGPSFGMPVEGMEAGSMEPAAFQSFTLDLLRQTVVMMDDERGKRRIELTSADKINQVFAGRFATIFKVIALVIKVNFEAFPTGSGNEAGGLPLPAR